MCVCVCVCLYVGACMVVYIYTYMHKTCMQYLLVFLVSHCHSTRPESVHGILMDLGTSSMQVCHQPVLLSVGV